MLTGRSLACAETHDEDHAEQTHFTNQFGQDGEHEQPSCPATLQVDSPSGDLEFRMETYEEFVDAMSASVRRHEPRAGNGGVEASDGWQAGKESATEANSGLWWAHGAVDIG